jgi:centromere protein F
MTENKALKETLEEKVKEADKYLDKYCSLLISHEELEKAKEILEIEVARLKSRQSRQDLQSSPLLNSSIPGPSPNTSVSEMKSASGQNKASGKRQRSSGIWEHGKRAAPSTAETFSKKSRKSDSKSTRPAEHEQETEFEPEGLPEVVKKGIQNY